MARINRKRSVRAYFRQDSPETLPVKGKLNNDNGSKNNNSNSTKNDNNTHFDNNNNKRHD